TGQTTISSGGGTVFTRLRLNFTGAGTLVTDAQTMRFSNANGAVHSLWRIDPAVTSMTVNAIIEASTAVGGPFSPADTFFGTTSTHRPGTGNTDRDKSHVDIGFYTSTCGDGATDTAFSREQCDPPGVCCTSTCQF